MGLQGLSLGGNPGAGGRAGGVGMHGAGGGQGLGMGPGPSVLSMPNLPNIATGQQAGGGMALPGSSIPMGLAHTGMGDTQVGSGVYSRHLSSQCRHLRGLAGISTASLWVDDINCGYGGGGP